MAADTNMGNAFGPESKETNKTPYGGRYSRAVAFTDRNDARMW